MYVQYLTWLKTVGELYCVPILPSLPRRNWGAYRLCEESDSFLHVFWWFRSGQNFVIAATAAAVVAAAAGCIGG